MKKQIVSSVMACKSAKEIKSVLDSFGAKFVSVFKVGVNGINQKLCKESEISTVIKSGIGSRIYAFNIDYSGNVTYYG